MFGVDAVAGAAASDAESESFPETLASSASVDWSSILLYPPSVSWAQAAASQYIRRQSCATMKVSCAARPREDRAAYTAFMVSTETCMCDARAE
jgi:hypothetical protein